MSEYQFVAFRAVDQPLTDQQLEFAESQSSHAEVTRWSLSVEYHYGEFRGDVDGLLRHGYDIFLQYTNYGVRQIRIRLPHGMPFAESIWQQYVDSDTLVWTSDSSGSGGILALDSSREPGTLDDIWEPQRYLDAVIQVRELLLRGDLRGLYTLWLCAGIDDSVDPEEVLEPPVPHGISEVESSTAELLSFFGLDPLMLAAAGEGVAAAPTTVPQHRAVAAWTKSLTSQRAKDLLQQILLGDAAGVKSSVMAEINESCRSTGWPTTNRRRRLEDLVQATERLRSEDDARQKEQKRAQAKREAAAAARARATRMVQMANDPRKWLRHTDELVAARGTANYEEAADVLFDLREAVGGAKGEKLACRHAAHLVAAHPTLSRLRGFLRKRDLLK